MGGAVRDLPIIVQSSDIQLGAALPARVRRALVELLPSISGA
jgi:hypothetical protein